MSTVSIGSGSDKLQLGVSEDPYQGDAQFTVSVDGQQVGGTLTTTAAHGNGPVDFFNVLGDWTVGNHAVTVNFLNDAWGGTPDTDRNLYLDYVNYDGSPLPEVEQELKVSGPVGFGVTDTTPIPAGSITVGSGSDTLTLKVSEDAYAGDAQFTVSVDGQQVGDTLTTTAAHSSGRADTINVLGNWAAGPHTVTVNFLNDAYGGTPDTDRNLYLDAATYNGGTASVASLALYAGGPQSFSLTDTGSLFIWDGSSPQPEVNPGDNLVFRQGTFMAQGSRLSGATVYLNGAQPSSPATLAVRDGSVGRIVLSYFQNNPRFPGYGALDVTGSVTIESPLSWGGSAPYSLVATLNGDATLTVNGGSLGRAASLVVNGAPGSTVVNTGTLSLSGTAQFAIHADLAGTGTIRSVPAPDSSGVTIELDGAVSAAQTVQLDGGTLQLDQPMRFMGTVAGLITSSPGGPASELRLEHSTVTGAFFQQSASNAGDLSIFTQDQSTGAAGTDVIHVAGSFASNAFVFTNDAATQSALIRLAPLPTGS